jgi:hypothetical protein
MTSISGLGPPGGPVRATRAPRGDARFGAALDAATTADVREAASSGSTSASSMLLSLQEVPDAAERNRRARARAEAALAALRGLQRALLGGTIGRAQLRELASAAAAATEAEDPALRELGEAVQLRAAIELARLDAQGL